MKKKIIVVLESVEKNTKNVMMINVVLNDIVMIKKIFILSHEKQKEKFYQVLI
jgi:hypothetical protein